MTEPLNKLMIKTAELEDELKQTGLWQNELPEWINEYDASSSITTVDFAQWLQFIFIPNHLKKHKTAATAEKKLLVPQAVKHFSNDVNKGKLLQILIEIDGLL